MSIFNGEIFEGARGFFDWLIRSKTTLFVGKIMAALGLGFAANKYVFDPFLAHAVSSWAAIPSMAATWIHALGIDTGLSLVLSAYGFRQTAEVFVRKVSAAGNTSP